MFLRKRSLVTDRWGRGYENFRLGVRSLKSSVLKASLQSAAFKQIINEKPRVFYFPLMFNDQKGMAKLLVKEVLHKPLRSNSSTIYSWTSPMMTVRDGRDAKRRVYDELHIGWKRIRLSCNSAMH